MSRIARSESPIYQTKGRPVHFPVEVTEPNGSRTDLTGATVAALAMWQGVERPLIAAVLEPATDGRILISGAPDQTRDWPIGRVAEILLTVTDSQDGALDFVWEVIGETP